MNELNYATREASKRLVDAGIVLVTDVKWYRSSITGKNYLTVGLGVPPDCCPFSDVPAPSIAEVWRELPETTHLIRLHDGLNEASIPEKDGDFCQVLSENINPIDALIDLLIWVRR